MANYSVNISMRQDEPTESRYEGQPDHKAALVSLPFPVAVVCCVLNFVIPGLGTILSGFASFCCSRHDDASCSHKCSVCTSSIIIGLLQLVLTVFLLIGWFWSCIWGVMFIGLAYKPQRQNMGERTTTVYMSQPSINIHFHNMSMERLPSAPPSYEELDHGSCLSIADSLVDLQSEPPSDADERPPPYTPP